MSLYTYAHAKPCIYCTVKERDQIQQKDYFFPSLPSASVAHSTMGRWISGPPTPYSYSSVCASSFWPPAQSICSIPILDLPSLCSLSMQILGMSHRNNKTVRPCYSHSPAVQNNGQLDKIKQSTLTLVKKDNTDHVLLNHSHPAAQKSRRILLSLLP